MGKKREADVEVERLPNLDGWEYFKAIDGADGRERWTLALQHEPEGKTVEYALWSDLKKDPEASGALDVRQGEDQRWAVAVREAIESSDEGVLDDAARTELVLAVLEQHDATLDSYQDRLLFALDAPSGDEEAEGAAGEDEEDGDEDDDSDEDDSDDEEDDDGN
jgi:hypothetical protein